MDRANLFAARAARFPNLSRRAQGLGMKLKMLSIFCYLYVIFLVIYMLSFLLSIYVYDVLPLSCYTCLRFYLFIYM